jgi:hypothetical protein
MPILSAASAMKNMLFVNRKCVKQIFAILTELQGSFKHIVTYRVVCVTKLTGSSSDDWIYWHFGYNLS